MNAIWLNWRKYPEYHNNMVYIKILWTGFSKQICKLSMTKRIYWCFFLRKKINFLQYLFLCKSHFIWQIRGYQNDLQNPYQNEWGKMMKRNKQLCNFQSKKDFYWSDSMKRKYHMFCTAVVLQSYHLYLWWYQ